MTKGSKKKLKIMIVDDEPDILEMLKYNLEKEDYKVFTASNGQEAYDHANRVLPDLFILDVMMPKMDGIELCKKLRANPKFKSTLITFLTARTEDFTQILALDIGGDDYILKPIKPSLLKSRIKALFRRTMSNVEDKSKIKLGNLTIDFEQITVAKKGEHIELTKKEFELLALLASKPGKVFRRVEIMNKVWGNEVIVGDRTIDVHIRKLREKIGNKYIKTLKGIGYKLDY
jgi:two-component system alkaline phosphatase synthesis response regulator PhoP